MHRRIDIAVFIAVLTIASAPRTIFAIDVLRFPDLAAEARGMRIRPSGDSPFVTGPARFIVQLADVKLFGLAQHNGVRVDVSRTRWAFAVAAHRAGLGVVTEQVATLELRANHDRATVAVRSRLETAAFAGLESAQRVSVGATSWITRGVATFVADVSGFGVSGAVPSSLAVRVGLAARPSDRIAMTSALDVASVAPAGVHVGTEVQLADALVIGAGYDAAAETVTAVATISARGIAVTAGARHHAVLGVSTGVTIAWRS